MKSSSMRIKRIQALYDNMRKWELDQHALEEFLVGCKQKEKIFLTLEEESRAFISLIEASERDVYRQKKYLGISRRWMSGRREISSQWSIHGSDDGRVHWKFLQIGIFYYDGQAS